MRIIGNPVKFGDGPAAVTLPFSCNLNKGTLLAVIYHCSSHSEWEGRQKGGEVRRPA